MKLRFVSTILTFCLLLIGQAVHAQSATIRQGTLIIANHPMVENDANYLRFIKYLTVPASNQAQPVFRGNNVRAIRALESPLHRQIFDAMNRNRVERFSFACLKCAQENFAMRLSAIHFMNSIEKGRSNGGVDFGYFGKNVPAEADPAHWQKGCPEFAFRTRPGVNSAAAISGIVSARFRGECLGAIEVTILQAAYKTQGAARFSRLHPHGLAVGPNSWSVRKHVRAAVISPSDMVPGDWVYMKNKDDYNTDLRPGVTQGYWNGENALYMGRYEMHGRFSPQYRSNAAQRFSGMGVYNVTDGQLRQELKKGYQSLMRVPFTFRQHTIMDGEIRWTQVSRLVVGG